MLIVRFTSLSTPGRLAVACAVALALIASVPAIGFAEQEQSQEHAEQLFAEGRQYFEDGDYESAIEQFQKAYDILGAPQLLYNIGEAHRRAENLVEAEHYFQKYLNEAEDPPNEEQVAERIIDLQQQLAAKKAVLNISSEPAGVTVTIDGEDKRCETPCTLELLPGDYTLSATKEGYTSASREIALEPNAEETASLYLQQKIAAGELFVRTDVDDATVQIGAETHSLPTTEPIQLDEGQHTLLITADGHHIEHDVDIDPDQPLQLFVPISQTGGGDFTTLQTAAIGLGATSLALGAAALFTGMQAQSTYDSLEAQQEAYGVVDADLVSTGKRQQSLSNGLWLGAAVGLAAGVGLFSWEFFRSDGPETLEPTEQPDGGQDVDVDML